MFFAIMVIAACLLVSTMFVVLFIMLVNYFLEGHLTSFQKIKFTQFQKFYSVNPNRWDLNNDYVSCYTNKQKCVCLRFGLVDYYRYKLWHRNIIKNKFKQEANKQMAEIIASVKQDIAESEAKAKRMQEEFLNTLKYTYENIPEDNLMNLVDEYKKLYGRLYKR